MDGPAAVAVLGAAVTASRPRRNRGGVERQLVAPREQRRGPPGPRCAGGSRCGQWAGFERADQAGLFVYAFRDSACLDLMINGLA